MSSPILHNFKEFQLCKQCGCWAQWLQWSPVPTWELSSCLVPAESQSFHIIIQVSAWKLHQRKPPTSIENIWKWLFHKAARSIWVCLFQILHGKKPPNSSCLMAMENPPVVAAFPSYDMCRGCWNCHDHHGLWEIVLCFVTGWYP